MYVGTGIALVIAVRCIILPLLLLFLPNGLGLVRLSYSNALVSAVFAV